MHTTESRLMALAAAGFTGTITLSLGAEGLNVRAALNRYDFPNTFKAEANGEGTKGAARLDAIIRAGEAFLDGDDTDLLPVRLPPRPPRLPDFDATEERRKANLPGAAQDDERARDLVTADQEMSF